MKGRSDTPHGSLTPALEAIFNLWLEGFAKLKSSGEMAALSAHTEIEHTPVSQKTGPFWRHFLPLRKAMVTLLAETYRRDLKLALAHPRQTGSDPDKWACAQLQPAVGATLEWIHDWYILACDGQNQWVQPIGTIEYAAGQTVSLPIPLTAPPFPPWKSWRAPAWLFGISLAIFGIGPLKGKHAPVRDSEEKLGGAHTRLLLKGARRVFLWELGAEIETVRNEETAAAGAIPAEQEDRQTRRPIKRKGWERKQKLYSAIQKVLDRNPSLEGMEFCAELDKRHAPPLFDWTKSGEWREGLTWKEAWGNPALRRKIRRVRQEAMKGR
jgi:hypothetical protein